MEGYQIEHLKGRTDNHGYDGPVKVNEGRQSNLGEAIAKAIKNAGYRFLDDTNSPEFEGFSRVQYNADKNGVRMSTAKAYLRPAMGRPNLHVVVKAHVSKVSVDHSWCFSNHLEITIASLLPPITISNHLNL